MAWRRMLKSKIHQAVVTEANLQYVGSITVDATLLEAADILPNEEVQVVDVDNGARLETYAIPGPPDSGVVCLNGAAARLMQKGDTIIILSYHLVDDKEAPLIKPKIVYIGEQNRIIKMDSEIHPNDIC